MADKEDAILAELVIEKYAEAKGLDVKEVKKKWLPFLQGEKEKDAFTEGLLNACTILGQIKEVGKGLDPQTQGILNKLSTIAVERAITGKTGKTEDEDEKLFKMVRRLKVLDHAFIDDDKLTAEIAEKVKREVSEPLAEALTGLRTTLENIAERVTTEPEVAENSEFAELHQTMENINTTLAHLTDKIDKGGGSQGDIETDIESMIARVNDATQKSRGFLEKQGFKIVAEDAPATLDEAQKIVESHGYTLQDKRVSREEALKMADAAAEAERKKHDDGLELKLEEKKIEAAKEVVGVAIDKVMAPFSYFLEQYLGTVFEGEVPVPGENPGTQETPAPAPAKKRDKPKPRVKAKRAGKR